MEPLAKCSATYDWCLPIDRVRAVYHPSHAHPLINGRDNSPLPFALLSLSPFSVLGSGPLPLCLPPSQGLESVGSHVCAQPAALRLCPHPPLLRLFLTPFPLSLDVSPACCFPNRLSESPLWTSSTEILLPKPFPKWLPSFFWLNQTHRSPHSVHWHRPLPLLVWRGFPPACPPRAPHLPRAEPHRNSHPPKRRRS